MFVRLLAFFIGIAAIFPMYAKADNTIVIDTYHMDVTGDGVNETIVLQGEKLASHSTYFPLVVIKIESQNDESWDITLPGGFKPTIQFVDVTNNGTFELLYKDSLNSSQQMYTNNIFTFDGNRFTSIPIPENSFAHGSFQENFIVHIHLKPHHEPKVIDVKDQATDYIDVGIYDKEGQLPQQQNAMIEPVHLIESTSAEESPTIISTSQKVSSMIDSSEIGTIQSTWIYEERSWKLLDTTWQE